MKRGIVLASLVFLAAAIVLLWPTTSPGFLHLRASVAGSRWTYGLLTMNDGRWTTVLEGVRSGRRAWLQVASDLRPAVDVHAGEELLTAVSSVFDRNPADAVEILVPAFGADAVCGRNEVYQEIGAARAEKRLARLDGLPQEAKAGDGFRQCAELLEQVRSASAPAPTP